MHSLFKMFFLLVFFKIFVLSFGEECVLHEGKFHDQQIKRDQLETAKIEYKACTINWR